MPATSTSERKFIIIRTRFGSLPFGRRVIPLDENKRKGPANPCDELSGPTSPDVGYFDAGETCSPATARRPILPQPLLLGFPSIAFLPLTVGAAAPVPGGRGPNARHVGHRAGIAIAPCDEGAAGKAACRDCSDQDWPHLILHSMRNAASAAANAPWIMPSQNRGKRSDPHGVRGARHGRPKPRTRLVHTTPKIQRRRAFATPALARKGFGISGRTIARQVSDAIQALGRALRDRRDGESRPRRPEPSQRAL